MGGKQEVARPSDAGMMMMMMKDGGRKGCRERHTHSGAASSHHWMDSLPVSRKHLALCLQPPWMVLMGPGAESDVLSSIEQASGQGCCHSPHPQGGVGALCDITEGRFPGNCSEGKGQKSGAGRLFDCPETHVAVRKHWQHEFYMMHDRKRDE